MIFSKKKGPRKPCLIAVALAILLSFNAEAQTTKKDLIGLGMSPELAGYIAGILPAGSVLGNNTYLKARNQANSADVEILKLDSTDNTFINAGSGKVIKYAVARTPYAQESASTRTLNISGSTYTIVTNDADGSDDSVLAECAGGAASDTRGSCIYKEGNEAGGRIQIAAGGVVGGDIFFQTGAGVTRERLDYYNNKRLAQFVVTAAATPAAGTNDILTQYAVFPTAAANAAAILPTPMSVGQHVLIGNTGPNAVRVKAGGTNTINGATAGGYVTLGAQEMARCLSSSTTNWQCSINAAPTPAGP